SDIKLVELTRYESRLLAFATYLFQTYYLRNRNKKIKAGKQENIGSIENSATSGGERGIRTPDTV
ncbi:MAG TPA: hypothetical protein LFW21_04770, partial [Rickettsia endosymbiont of Pyrocoelia pectoralis]|nr:hypothetical protein [Rickettsia endosymbiont of Pyrocoelia pectoralis]